MEAYDRQAELLKALAHPVRLQILDILRDGERCVCHIEAVLGLRQAYVSQQLIALRKAGLVADRKDGLRVYYCIADRAVLRVLDRTRAMLERQGVPFSMPDLAPHDCPCPSCSSQVTASTGRLTILPPLKVQRNKS
jgi:DNA-binding transcriptional ArsR family regulator